MCGVAVSARCEGCGIAVSARCEGVIVCGVAVSVSAHCEGCDSMWSCWECSL